MSDDIRIVIGADAREVVVESGKARHAIRGVGDEARRAARAAGVYQDAQGRWRESNGRFASSARQVELGLKGIDDQQKRNHRSSQALTAMWGRQRQTLSGLYTGIQRTTFALGAMGAYTAKQALTSGIRFNAQMESNTIALEQLTGSADKAQAVLGDLFEIARKTPFKFADVTDAARKFLAFGFTIKDTETALRATGDAVAALGGGAEKINRITIALGQIQAKGRVQGDELLQLAEAGIPAYQILAEKLNLSAKEIKNIGQQGIPAKKAIDALVTGMQDRFAGATAAQAKSFDGMWSTIQDDAQRALGAMTEGLFSELKRWMPEVDKAANHIAKLWDRDDLTPEQKFRRSWRTIQRDLGPILRDIEGMVDDLHLDDKLTDAFNDALPIVAEAAAKLAVQGAKSFGDAFLHSSPLGRLALATWLLSKTGGLAAFRAVGRQSGGAFSAGMATTVAGGGAGGWKASLVAGAKQAGIAAAIAAGLAFGPEWVEQMKDNISNKTPDFDLPKVRHLAFDMTGGWLDKAIIELGGGTTALEDFGEHAEDTFKKLRKAGDAAGLARLAQQARDLAREFPDAATELQRFAIAAEDGLQGRVVDSFQAMRRAGGKSLSDIRNQVIVSKQDIWGRLGTDTQAAKDAMAHNFRLAAAAIRESMAAGKISTKTGLAQIEKYMREALALYGITGKQAGRYLRGEDTTGTGSLSGGNESGGVNNTGGTGGSRPQTGIPPEKVATGGVFVGRKGAVSRDNTPAMLNGRRALVAEGELVGVFNRHQIPEMDARFADYGGLAGFMAANDRPHHMASGGIVPRPGGPGGMGALGGLVQAGLDRVRAGAQFRLDSLQEASVGAGGPLPKGVSGSVADAIRVAMGLGAGYPSPGQLTSGQHAKSSLHYSGRAVDISTGPLREIFFALLQTFGSSLNELFYDPIGFYVDNHQKVPGAIGGHGDHIHAAFNTGGLLRAAAGTVMARTASSTGRRRRKPTAAGIDVAAFDHIYAKDSPDRLTVRQTRAVFENAGFSPGRALQMAQIAHGESGYMPGNLADNGDGGIGLVQITPTDAAWGAGWQRTPLGRKFFELGGYAGMRNPVQNARMAKYMYDQAGGFAPWHGTRFLDQGAHTRGVRSVLGRRSGVTMGPSRRLPNLSKVKGKYQRPPRRRETRGQVSGLLKGWVEANKAGAGTGLGFLPDVHKLYDQPREGLEADLSSLLGEQARTDEQPIVNGPDGQPAINWDGMIDPDTGRMVPGINHRLGELAALLMLHTGSPDGQGAGGILGNLTGKAATIRDQILPELFRRGATTQQQLATVKALWEANHENVLSERADLARMRGKGITWQERAGSAQARIGRLQAFLDRVKDDRARGLTIPNETRQAENQARKKIAAERALIGRLETNKPPPKLGRRPARKKGESAKAYRGRLAAWTRNSQRFSTDYREHQQSIADSRAAMVYLAGSTGKWQTSDGVAGKVKDRLDAYTLAGGEFNTELHTTLERGQIPQERTEVNVLLDEMGALRGTVLPKRTDTGGSDGQLAGLLKSQLEDQLRSNALLGAQFDVFKGFAPLAAGRLVGSFARGSDYIPRDGLAQVHRGEQIVPATDGPFQITARDMTQGGGRGGDTRVELVLGGEIAGLVRLIDARINDQAPRVVSEQLGRRQRLITSAPGGQS